MEEIKNFNTELGLVLEKKASSLTQGDIGPLFENKGVYFP
jgi:hypothetical protein